MLKSHWERRESERPFGAPSLSGRRATCGGPVGHRIRPGNAATCLSVSRSGNALGFRVEDFEPYEPGDGNNNDDGIDELKFSRRDFDSYLEESLEVQDGGRPMVRPLDPRTASPTSKYIAASLLKNMAEKNNAQAGSGGRFAAKTRSRVNEDGEVQDTLPFWFPWVPTQSQINSLKVVELRAACADRGILTTGRKAELQRRLLAWATMRDRQRVRDRLSDLAHLLELSKSREAAAARALEEVEEIAREYDVDTYDVEGLANKRRAFTKDKKRGRGESENNRGILGLIDESYFNTTGTGAELDQDENEDDEEEQLYNPDKGEHMVTSASLSRLAESFNAPSSNFSNREVRQMYLQAKIADQAGDRARSKALLSQLRDATPRDMRVVRRLSRMEMEDGNLAVARGILTDGLRSEPDNAHLLHGLGQLERKAGNDLAAKKLFRRASEEDPMFANSYHALGTLEHTHGNIRTALAVIKEGIENCPKNHRLHHALGDVYLDANMLDLAEQSYLEGLRHGPHWSKSFAYTSLSFVSYARGHPCDARTLLKQSLEVNGGMHAQGVIALAQLEESEGNIDEARKVYRDAVSRYEKRRRARDPIPHHSTKPAGSDVFDVGVAAPGMDAPMNKQGTQYNRSYSGDKWINVFHSWARMEQIHGTYETAHIVFGKAARLFPNNVSLLIKWAELQAANHRDGTEKARLLYEAACHLVGGRSAEPYWKFAIFEMRHKDFVKARSVLLRGAQALGAGSSSSQDSIRGLAHLFHTWGVCEYHLGSHSRAEELFDDALRVMGSEDGDFATMRSLILYSMARLEFARGEYLLAQHCIGLSLKENLLPGGNSLMWKLWCEIAEKMENAHLVARCKEQALLRYNEERSSNTMVSDLSRLLGNGQLPERTGSAMKDMFRRTPWYSKVCPPTGRIDKKWYSGAKLWDL